MPAQFEKGLCPGCFAERALRSDGTFRPHEYRPTTVTQRTYTRAGAPGQQPQLLTGIVRKRHPCPGSFRAPGQETSETGTP